MTTIEKLNKSKVPIIPIDKRLEKYRGKVLFPEKLARANEIIAKPGIPKLKNKSCCKKQNPVILKIDLPTTEHRIQDDHNSHFFMYFHLSFCLMKKVLMNKSCLIL